MLKIPIKKTKLSLWLIDLYGLLVPLSDQFKEKGEISTRSSSIYCITLPNKE